MGRFQSTKFFLTYPQNTTTKEQALDRIKRKFSDKLDYCVVGHEHHKDKGDHLHCYVKLHAQYRTSNIHDLDVIGGKHGNYQVAKTEFGSVKYVTKEGDYVTHNINAEEYIKRCEKKVAAAATKGVGHKITQAINEGTSLQELTEAFPAYMLANQRRVREYLTFKRMVGKPEFRNWEMEVIVNYGAAGTGKSKEAFDNFHPTTHYVLREGNNGNVWFDGYEGQENLIIDDFYGWLKFSFLLKLLDRYPLMVDTKGGSVQFVSKRIYITSNNEPKKWYKKVPEESLRGLYRRFTNVKRYQRCGRVADVTEDYDITKMPDLEKEPEYPTIDDLSDRGE